MKTKNLWVAILCVAVTITCGVSIYFSQFHRSVPNKALHIGVGRGMAQETARLLGGKGKLVVLDMETSRTPELEVQFDEFEKILKKLGQFSIRRKTYDTEGKAKYGVGSGLSVGRFVRAIKNYQESDAIVSFIGAPGVDKEDEEELSKISPEKMPKFIAEVRAAEKLRPLFEKKLIHVAIVSRFEFPSGVVKPRTPEQWFKNRFQVVTGTNAATLP